MIFDVSRYNFQHVLFSAWPGNIGQNPPTLEGKR